MQRLRLKADGRIVELRDGQEFPLAPEMPTEALTAVPCETAALPAVRDLRRRARLTQTEFASRLGVPVETIRNWEQGKRAPRGPGARLARGDRAFAGYGIRRFGQRAFIRVEPYRF
jgi:putative transcriptional regulator